MIFYFLYFLAVLLVAYIGRNSRIGFWGIAVASFFFTPILVLILTVLFGRRVGV
jgi:hypothetical protein